MRVAEKIAEWLHEKGIKHVFGIIGAGNVVLFDAIADQGQIEIIPCHHEQAAVMAASYYYRISNLLAPAIVTTGGGSINACTGVLAAYMDSIPCLVISGNEPLHFFNRQQSRVVGVQGYKSARLAQQITKYAQQALTPVDAMFGLEKCYEDALAPRQGPCWLDIPQDIQRMEA